MSSQNPKKWRFTWESQSLSPTLRLFLFDSHTNPKIQCQNLKITLNLSNPHLLVVTWTESQNDTVQQQVSLRVPIPTALIDHESPISFNSLNDHIEVKLVLLLPVDHPLISVLNSSDDTQFVSAAEPLVMDYDIKSLSSMEEGVHFYCRSCSRQLTTSPIRHFEEQPSVNWREVADNWFGACCCSFGGISEKLVTRFANAYTCAKGIGLLTSTTVTLYKDDLLECEFDLSEDTIDSGSNYQRVASCDGESERMCSVNGSLRANLKCEVTEEGSNGDKTFCTLPVSDLLSENVASVPGCCDHTIDDVRNRIDELSVNDACETSTKSMELMANQKSFLNGFLGNIFMARSSNLSTNIEWIEFVCPQCSSLLGAYPRGSGESSVDGGVRFFKCYVSTSLPVGGSGDLFRKYTLEKMFTTQLLESAKDELSFRTVVRDLTTKSPILQIVLLNPTSWCCTGYCLGTEGTMESISKLDLHPVIKVLFSDCSDNTKSQLRILEDWVTKNLADEVFMMTRQIEELIESLTSAKDILPPSCAFLQGLPLSSMQR